MVGPKMPLQNIMRPTYDSPAELATYLRAIVKRRFLGYEGIRRRAWYALRETLGKHLGLSQKFMGGL
jgi:hypothetical protein